MKTYLLVFAAFASGCSFNNYGLLFARITQAQGARVLDIYNLGIHLRSRNEDPGVTFGLSKRSYVYPDTFSQLPEPGYHYFFVGMPPEQAIAQDARIFGLEASTRNADWSLTLGYSGTTILARASSDSNGFLDLSYQPSDPLETKLKYCEGKILC